MLPVETMLAKVILLCKANVELRGRTTACVPIPPRRVAVPAALVQRSLTVWLVVGVYMTLAVGLSICPPVSVDGIEVPVPIPVVSSSAFVVASTQS